MTSWISGLEMLAGWIRSRYVPAAAAIADERRLRADRASLDLDVEWEPRPYIDDELARVARRVVELHWG